MRLGRAALHALSLSCVMLACSLPARAQTVNPELSALLVSEDCEPELTQSLTKLLAIELDSLEQERSWSVSERISKIVVSCQEQDVAVEARSVAGNTARRQLTLDAVEPADRPRAVALAATELVDQLRLEETSKPRAPEVAPRPEPAPAEPPRERRSKPVRASLLLGAGIAHLGQPATTLPAGSLLVRPRLGKYFELSTELEFARGQAETALAGVDVESYAAAASVIAATDWGASRWGVGLGLRAGFVRLDAVPEETSGFVGERLEGFWSGAALALHVLSAPSAIFSARKLQRYDVLIAGTAEAGLVFMPLLGTDDLARDVFEINGAWLRLSASVGLAI